MLNFFLFPVVTAKAPAASFRQLKVRSMSNLGEQMMTWKIMICCWPSCTSTPV